MLKWLALLSLAGQLPGLLRPCFASPTRDGDRLKFAAQITEVGSAKEFYVRNDAGDTPYHELQVFVVARETEDPLRKGWYEFEFVGRAAVAETASNTAHFVLYKPFKGMELKKGDRILETGDPLTLDEMDLMRKEVLSVLTRDKELEDLYAGLISVKLGFYDSQLSSTSQCAGPAGVCWTNIGKGNTSNNGNPGGGATPSFLMTAVGLRWWFFFNPQLGFNFDFARSGSISTTGERGELETSAQTNFAPGLIYRGRLLFIPTIYSLSYFFNSFSTSNTTDALLSSTYSGLNLGITFYLPYRLTLLRLGPVSFSFNNLEAGVAYAPSVSVSDSGFSRGSNSAGSQFSLSGGIEFNLAIRGLRFTNDLFFVGEAGEQFLNLSFSGTTSGDQQNGQPIPPNGIFSEMQTFYGVRIKYNMRDYIGELMGGI